MLRTMKTSHLAGLGAAALLLCYGIFSQAQSLGDVARQQRIANSKNTHRADHVITNEDIPSRPQAVTSAQKQDSDIRSAQTRDPRDATATALQSQIKALKARIAAMKAHMTDLQTQMDKGNSGCMITAYRNSCAAAKRLQAEADRTQAEIDTEQKYLEQTQEQVRQMGYGNAFYDPE